MENKLTTESEKLKNGSYGMFSESQKPSFSTPRAFVARRKQALQHENVRRKLFKVGKRRRRESPLFELEHGYDSKGHTSDDKTVEIASPSEAARSRQHGRHHGGHHSALKGGRQEHPIIVPDVDSDSDCAIILDTSKERASKLKQLDIQAVSQIFKDSPLPGNVDLLPRYLEIIESLSEQYVVRESYLTSLRRYDKEDERLAQQLADLPIEQAKQEKVIIDACTAAIRKDMAKMIFNSNEEIEKALNKRQAEAKEAREKLVRLLPEKAAGYETQRNAIPGEKAEVESRIRDTEVNLKTLMQSKAELEAEGGMAMAFALGQYAVARPEEKKKRRRAKKRKLG